MLLSPMRGEDPEFPTLQQEPDHHDGGINAEIFHIDRGNFSSGGKEKNRIRQTVRLGSYICLCGGRGGE